MYEIPKTYEEAKKVIEGSTKDKYTQRFMNLLRLKALFTTVISTGVLMGVAHLLGTPAPIEYVLPVSGIIEFAGLIPVIQRRIVNGQIKEGSYFEKKDKEFIMSAATEYARSANAFEERNIKK
jgi:hypothetical protein